MCNTSAHSRLRWRLRLLEQVGRLVGSSLGANLVPRREPLTPIPPTTLPPIDIGNPPSIAKFGRAPIA